MILVWDWCSVFSNVGWAGLRWIIVVKIIVTEDVIIDLIGMWRMWLLFFFCHTWALHLSGACPILQKMTELMQRSLFRTALYWLEYSLLSQCKSNRKLNSAALCCCMLSTCLVCEQKRKKEGKVCLQSNVGISMNRSRYRMQANYRPSRSGAWFVGRPFPLHESLDSADLLLSQAFVASWRYDLILEDLNVFLL